MYKPRPTPSRRLTCTDVRTVEVDLPRTLRPRLVIQFSEGLSLLLEDQAAIPLAAEFIATFRKHLAAKVSGLFSASSRPFAYQAYISVYAIYIIPSRDRRFHDRPHRQ